MKTLTQSKFLQTMPDVVMRHLPEELQTIKWRQPWRWLMQFHYGEARLHYEISHASQQGGWEVGFHCEARDKNLNRFLLDGFRRHLFEIKDVLGEKMEAEMWVRGWSKIYEVVPDEPLTEEFQDRLGQRMAEVISCLHPFYVDLRDAVAQSYR